MCEETGVGEVLLIPRRFKSYEVVGTIGRGATAVVLEVVDHRTHGRFAAKMIPRPEANSEALRFRESEFRLSMRLSSPFLVRCVDIVYMKDVIGLIMEYFEGSDLLTVALSDRIGLCQNWRKTFSQICLGVQYLHRRGIAHRDLKPENVLVDKDFNCKLCDYGLMCEVTGQCQTLCGTVQFMAPEMIRGEIHCAKKADMWALGITLYAAMTGCFPWMNYDGDELVEEILSQEVDVSLASRDVGRIVRKCCDGNPEKRANIEEVMKMSFVELPKERKSTRRVKTLNYTQTPKLASVLQKITSSNSFRGKSKSRGSANVEQSGSCRHIRFHK